MGLFAKFATPVGAAPGSVTVVTTVPGAIKHALCNSGWVVDDVLAAGHLRQGRPPTMAGMLTGAALVELARPRRSRTLPRQFVLAVTADEVIAFRASNVVIGEGTLSEQRLTIKDEVCARWPRASLRLLDLDDGARSRGATLHVGDEEVPVSRGNLEGDPSTDELLALLGGLAPASAARRERGTELTALDRDELAADARRGRPAVELAGWAERRGLRFRDGASQAGHLNITCPWSEELLFNVVRGRWPGGTDGVLCHVVRLLDVDTPGYFHGGKAIGTRRENLATFLLDEFVPLPAGGGAYYFKVPYTCAGARVPHLGPLTGLHVERAAERRIEIAPRIGSWHEHRLGDGWVAHVRRRSDPRTVAALLEGPVRELLARPQPLGFEIHIEYGQAGVARQDFLKRDEDLDAFVATAEALAAAVREICAPRTGRLALSARLPEPEWLAAVSADLFAKHTLWPPGARLEKVVAIAHERGMAVEDPRAFHAAFADLNLPGEAFGVLHGRLPGTEIVGRLLCCAERPMVLPDDARKLLRDPGGAVGCDVAVLEVDPSATPTPPEGETVGDVRVAVAGGVLTAWRIRPSWQADGESLDRLTADVVAIARRRALV